MAVFSELSRVEESLCLMRLLIVKYLATDGQPPLYVANDFML